MTSRMTTFVSMPSIYLRLARHLGDRYTLNARGLKRNVSYASVLHTHNNRAVLKNREMNSIAGLEIRSGPHFFGDSRLTFTGNSCERHIGLHPFLRLVIL